MVKILNISNDLKASNWLKIEDSYKKLEKLLYVIIFYEITCLCLFSH